jgi:DNA-binding transcriptional ArsR family regulator
VLTPGISVTELARMIGMKPQAVSNQLQRLNNKGILSNVREGVSTRYRVVAVRDRALGPRPLLEGGHMETSGAIETVARSGHCQGKSV